MLGFIFGAVCLIGLVKVLRHRRRLHGPFGYGGYGYGCSGGHGTDRGLRGRHWLLRSVFERLETTPGQEKTILAALHELSDSRSAVLDEARQTRADVGRTLAGGLVDESALDETFARHDRLLAQLRVTWVEALKKISEALDERQRAKLAEWLEGDGWFTRGRWGGPYRAMWL